MRAHHSSRFIAFLAGTFFLLLVTPIAFYFMHQNQNAKQPAAPTQIFDSASTDAVAYADTAEIALLQSDGVVATVAPLPDISGMVFADTNNNNQYDPQIDLTMRGVQMQLSFDSKLIAETMTETDGSYIFARPDAKIYMVEVMVPDGYTTTQKTGMVTPIGSMSAQMPINFMIKPRPTL